jgi:hypothetical protein
MNESFIDGHHLSMKQGRWVSSRVAGKVAVMDESVSAREVCAEFDFFESHQS